MTNINSYKRFLEVFFGILLLLLTTTLHAQLQLNEICASNNTILFDEFNDHPDWIELYNAGTSPINLKGYYLSDDIDELTMWQFPEATIDPGAYMVIFASDRDTQAVALHTNFKVSKNGESVYFLDPDENIIDQIFVPPIESDISYGRRTESASDWQLFYTPTPGISNENSDPTLRSNPPSFATENRFYTAAYEVVIQQGPGTIRYTTNGNEPTEESTVYEGPLILNSSATIRARTFESDKLPSKTVTQNYFLDVYHDLPLVAIATDSAGLYDFHRGIFVKGPNAESDYPFYGANYWKDTIVVTNFEYFKEDRSVGNFDVGMKIHGGKTSRTRPMKSVRFIANQRYGAASMKYPFFEEKENDDYNRLILRSSSGDFNKAHIRDPFIQDYLINEPIDLDAISAQPVIAYINGQYHGVMYLREKIDQFYIEDNFDVLPSDMDLLEEDTILINGSFEIFHEMHDFVVSNDLTIPENFDKAASYFDLSNMADYFICQTYVNNTDWPNNNLKHWREKSDSAKWRYIMFDLDAALARFIFTEEWLDNISGVLKATNNPHVTALQSFLQNENFKNYFINRYADLINTTLGAEAFSAAADRAVDDIASEMPAHFDKWTSSNMAEWQDEQLPKIYKFLEGRPDYARGFIQDHFELVRQVSLTFSTVPEGLGDIQINSIKPKLNPEWTGIYYDGVPIDLMAPEIPGFSFSHWESDRTIVDDENRDIQLTQNFSQDDHIRAVYKPLSDPPKVDLVSLTEGMINIEVSKSQQGALQLNVFSADGKSILQTINRNTPPGLTSFQIDPNILTPGIYFILVQDALGRTVRKYFRP